MGIEIVTAIGKLVKKGSEWHLTKSLSVSLSLYCQSSVLGAVFSYPKILFDYFQTFKEGYLLCIIVKISLGSILQQQIKKRRVVRKIVSRMRMLLASILSIEKRPKVVSKMIRKLMCFLWTSSEFWSKIGSYSYIFPTRGLKNRTNWLPPV